MVPGSTRARVILAFFVLAGFAVAPPVSATEAADGSALDAPSSLADMVALDSWGDLVDADVLDAQVDSVNRTIDVQVTDASPQPLALFLKESWVHRTAAWPGFSGAVFSRVEYSGTTWLRVAVPDAVRGLSFRISEFRPELNVPSYSLGSPASVYLERSMGGETGI